MTQKDKLKLMLLGKSNPQLALLTFMEQMHSEMKEKMDTEMNMRDLVHRHAKDVAEHHLKKKDYDDSGRDNG